MDLYAALRELYTKRKRLERTIARLEKRQRAIVPTNPQNRGRKSMPLNERMDVSRRMKAYWAARREQR